MRKEMRISSALVLPSGNGVFVGKHDNSKGVPPSVAEPPYQFFFPSQEAQGSAGRFPFPFSFKPPCVFRHRQVPATQRPLARPTDAVLSL